MFQGESSPRLSLLLGNAVLCWHRCDTAEPCLSRAVARSGLEQLQTASDIIHHLFFPHDCQDSAGPRLHLPKTRRVGLELSFTHLHAKPLYNTDKN